MIRTLESDFPVYVLFSGRDDAKMADADDLVRQAVSAFKAGRKAEARSILERVVEQNESHAEAWLYLSALVDSLEEQEICLENVLALDPANEKAKKGLETVRQKIASQKKASPPTGAEFESISGDSPFGNMPSEPQASFGSGSDPTPPPEQVYGWFSGPPAADQPPDNDSDSDSNAIPTSVDWGRDDKPATYGSGQNVEMPSAQEWDSWVQGLNITSDQPEEAAPPPAAEPFDSGLSPFLTDDDAPFGQTAYMVDDEGTGLAVPPEDADSEPFGDEPFGSPSPWPSPFGDDVAASEDVPEEESFAASETSDDAPSAFAAGPFDTTAVYEEEEAVPTDSAFAFDADEVEIGEEDLVFDFDDDEDDDLDIESAPQSEAATPKPGAEYFRLIPGEIEAKAGGIGQRSLMMLGGIVVLVLLNAISFALLLL
jgi:hypothetical protein